MLGKMTLDPDSDASALSAKSGQLAEDAAGKEEGGGRVQRFVNWVLDRSARQHAERHGCWYNRSVGEVLKECEEAGVVVVEGWEGVWWYVTFYCSCFLGAVFVSFVSMLMQFCLGQCHLVSVW